MTTASVTRKRRGFKAYRRQMYLGDMIGTETDAAAAEGRCKGRISPSAYQELKTQEAAEYLDPWQRLDFWTDAEAALTAPQTV